VFSKLDATLSSAGAARLSKRQRHAPAEAVNCNLIIIIDFFGASYGFNSNSCIIHKTIYHTRWLKITGVDVLHAIQPQMWSLQASIAVSSHLHFGVLHNITLNHLPKDSINEVRQYQHHS
jgi:hypothetical protein